MRFAYVLPFLLALSAVGCGQRAEEEPYVLGHVAPLTGPNRPVGEDEKRGIEIALEELNKTEVRKQARSVVVLHADTRSDPERAPSDPERARSEAVRLVTINRAVAVLGGVDHKAAESLALGLQPYTVPLVTPTAFRRQAALEGVTSLDASAAFRGEVLARFASQDLKKSKALLLTAEDRPICVAIAGAFERHWRTLKDHSLSTAVLDDKLTAEAAGERVSSTGAEVVAIAGSADEASRVLGTLGKGSATVIFAGEASEWERLKGRPEAAKVHAAVVYVPSAFTEEAKKFVARFEERFNTPPGLNALAGYEGATVLVRALRDSRAVGGARLREELTRDREFEGMTGKFKFKDGHASRSLYVVQGPGAAPLKEFEKK